MALFVFKPSCKEEYIKVLKFFVTICGCWPIEKCKGGWLYHLYAFVVSYMVLFLFLLTLIIDICLSFGDLEATADASYLCITELTFFIKLMIFTVKKGTFRRLLDLLEEPIYTSTEYTAPEINWSTFATNYSRAFFCCCFCCSVFFGIFPMIEKDEDNILPFNGWFPFDVKYSLVNRAIVYGLQMFGMCISISLNASLDILPAVFMNIACTQIEVLEYTLENAIHQAERIIGKRHLASVRISVTQEETVEQLSIEQDNIVHDILCHCVQHQLAIIKLIKDVENFFSTAIMIQFMASAMTITITGLQMIVVPFSLKYMAVVTYLASVLFEISLYCWSGHQVIVKSSSIGESCYNLEWYRCSERVKKMIFIIMERSKIPIKLTAGSFFILSIETLTAIFRTSYSYFAVLRQIYGE